MPHQARPSHLCPMRSLCLPRAFSAMSWEANCTNASPVLRPRRSSGSIIPLGTISNPNRPTQQTRAWILSTQFEPQVSSPYSERIPSRHTSQHKINPLTKINYKIVPVRTIKKHSPFTIFVETICKAIISLEYFLLYSRSRYESRLLTGKAK